MNSHPTVGLRELLDDAVASVERPSRLLGYLRARRGMAYTAPLHMPGSAASYELYLYLNAHVPADQPARIRPSLDCRRLIATELIGPGASSVEISAECPAWFVRLLREAAYRQPGSRADLIRLIGVISPYPVGDRQPAGLASEAAGLASEARP